VNDELEKRWKKTVMTHFKVVSQNFPAGTEENHKNLIQDSQSLGQDSNLGPPQYEEVVLRMLSHTVFQSHKMKVAVDQSHSICRWRPLK
jgi:hypothetical protein